MELKKLVMVVVFLLGMAGVVNVVTAQAAEGEESGPSFTWALDFPENQRSKEGYLDLVLEPGARQTVTVTVKNQTARTIKVKSKLSRAHTNYLGVIEYGSEEVTEGKLPPISEMIQVVSKLTLAPYETRSLDLNIVMPTEKFAGIQLAGLQLSEEQETAITSGLSNTYSYLIGIQLCNDPTPVLPDLALVGVKLGYVNQQNALVVAVENEQNAILNQVTLDVKIKKKDTESILYTAHATDLRLAPVSTLYFPVFTEQARVQPGHYTALVQAQGANELTETWEQDFEISAKTASLLNVTTVEAAQPRMVTTMLKVLFATFVLVFIVCLTILIKTNLPIKH